MLIRLRAWSDWVIDRRRFKFSSHKSPGIEALRIISVSSCRTNKFISFSSPPSRHHNASSPILLINSKQILELLGDAQLGRDAFQMKTIFYASWWIVKAETLDGISSNAITNFILQTDSSDRTKREWRKSFYINLSRAGNIPRQSSSWAISGLNDSCTSHVCANLCHLTSIHNCNIVRCVFSAWWEVREQRRQHFFIARSESRERSGKNNDKTLKNMTQEVSVGVCKWT